MLLAICVAREKENYPKFHSDTDGGSTGGAEQGWRKHGWGMVIAQSILLLWWSKCQCAAEMRRRLTYCSLCNQDEKYSPRMIKLLQRDLITALASTLAMAVGKTSNGACACETDEEEEEINDKR